MLNVLRLLFLALIVTTGATAADTWTGSGGDGLWNTAANWSAGVPTSGTSVIIPSGQSVSLTVTTAALSGLDLIGNLTLAGSGDLVFQSATTLTLDGGTLTLQGGQLQSAAIAKGSGGAFVATTSGGTLSSVIIGSGVTFDLSVNNGSQCTINGGLTVTGTVQLGSSSTGNYGQLYASGTQSWTGSGTIVFGQSTNNSINGSGSNAAVTLGAGFTISGGSGSINFTTAGGSFTNQGTIDQATSGGSITISAVSWTNQAVMEIGSGGSLTLNSSTAGTNATGGQILSPNGGTITLGGPWSNSGTISGAATVYNLGGSFTTPNGLSVSTTASNTVNITGTVDDSNNLTFTSTSSPWYLHGGTINGGTITASGGNELIVTSSGGTLNNITIPSGTTLDLAQVNGAQCTINGLTLNGAVALGSPSTSNYGQLYLPGTQTWTGAGTITFGQNSSNSINGSGSSAAFTLGTGLTITGGSGSINFTGAGGSFTNQGTIDQATSGGGITISAVNWTNQAVMEIGSGGSLTLNSSTAGVNATGGQILSPSGGTITLGGPWSNNGTISGASTIYNLGGSFTTPNGLSVSTTASNTVNITGTVDDSNNLTFTSTSSPWYLHGGTINGGTITASGSNELIVTSSGGTLNNITIPSGTTLDLTQLNGAQCTINGLTLNGAVALGSPSTSNYGQLYLPGTQTWTGAGTITFGQNSNNSINGSGSSAAFTLGTGLTITGGSGSINFTGAGGSFTNQGTIDQATSGGGITISAVSWTNQAVMEIGSGGSLSLNSTVAGLNDTGGHILSPSGGTISLSGPWSNSGVISGASTVYNLGGSFTTANGLSVSTTASNTVNITGTVDDSNNLTFTSTSSPWYLHGGTINGGTITASGSNELIVTSSGGTLNNITIPSGTTLDLTQLNGAQCTINGLALDGAIALGSPSSSNYGQLYLPGTQTWTGAGTITFGQSSNNSINGSGSSAAFTLGSGLTITGGSGSINFTGSGGSFTNQGTIDQATSGGGITISAVNWTNQAVMEIGSGGSLSLNSTSAGINATGGHILSPGGGTINLGGPWSNAGVISGASTVYNLGGSFTSAAGLTVSTTSSNTVNITGTVDDTSNLTFTSTSSPWYLHGGTITGGTITASGSNELILTNSGGTLSNVAIPVGTTLDMTLVNGAQVTISGGLSLNGTFAIGSPSSANYGQVYASGVQAWSGSGSIVFGQSSNNSLNGSGSNASLTLDAGLTLTGNRGTISFTSSGDSFTNAGTITSTVAGGAINISALTWSNQGTITVGANTAQTWNCSGAFTETPSAVLNLEVGGTGAGQSDLVAIAGTAAVAGTLNLTTINGYFLHQGDAITLITTNAGGMSGSFSTVNGSFSVAVNSASLVATAIDATTPTVTVTPAAAYTHASPVGFNVVFSEPVTGLTIGSLTVGGGIASSLSGSGRTYAVTITPTSLTGGVTNEAISLQVPAGVAQNSGSHANAASNSASTLYEITPTIAISPANNAVVSGPPTFTLTFSNPVTGLQASGLALSNATVVAITPAPTILTSSYTITTDMAGGGAMQFQVLADAVTDQAGNANAASTTETVINDPTPPTIVSITPTTGSSVSSSPTFVVTLSEAVTGLSAGELGVVGGTIGTITPSSTTSTTTYQIPVTANASGSVGITVPANAVQDSLGGTNSTGASDTLTVTLTPAVTSVSPAVGPTSGGTAVTVNGSSFDVAATVTFGGTTATVIARTPTALTVTSPAHAIGPATVVVANSDLRSGTDTNAFTYQGAAPTLTGVSPSTGPLGGGTVVSLTGTNFQSGATVMVGGQAATAVTVVSSTSITATIPPGVSGPASVVVTNLDTQSATLSNGFTYQGPAPTVSAISPTSGSSGGGTAVTITGTAFVTGVTVTIGSRAATSVTLVNATTITAITPSGATGPADVVITNPDTQHGTLVSGYTFVSGAPSVSSCAPSVGPQAGGTTVTLTGTNFASGASVTFAGRAATSVVVQSATSITATTPSNAVGPATIVVTNPDTQTATLPNGFTYQGVPPSLATVTPASGPAAGGSSVTLAGDDFLAGATVTFGGIPATSVVVIDSSTITAVTPPGAVGPQAVVVTNVDLQTATLPSGFLYQGVPPTITACSPGQGPLAGGTTITLTGTGFATGAAVTIGGLSAQGITVVSATTLTCTTPPAGAGGPVNVVLTNLDTQTTTLVNGFTYLGAAPTLTAVSPGAGPQSGETSVTLTGTNFQVGATVTFGGVAAGSATVVSSTTITVSTPSSTAFGPVSVVVTNPDSQSATLPNGFIVQGPTPSVTGVTPALGSTAGGTSILITGTNFVAGGVVTVGGVAAQVTSLAATSLSALTPAGASGTVAISVTNLDQQVATLPAAFTYVAPSVSVSAGAGFSNQSQLSYTITYSLPVPGLAAADLSVQNGAIDSITGGPLVYTVDITPSANGPVAVKVLADAAAGIPASNVQTVIYDTIPPQPRLSIASGVPLQGASTTLTIDFGEPVQGFTSSGLTVLNGIASGFTEVDASTYTLVLTANPNPIASLQVLVPAGTCSDLAQNASLAGGLVVPVQTTIVSTSLVTPPVALSGSDGTTYIALCPGTWAGLGQLQAFLGGEPANLAIGYVWDAAAQGFVEVPRNAPQGGWQPFQGVYLATRVAPSFDFNGEMSTVDYALTLKPGWNFVGIPPLEDNGTETVSHQWGDLLLEDISGDHLTGPDRINLIGSGAWSWNGSSYVQVSSALQSGVGYWIENSSSPGVDLVLRRLSAAEIGNPALILGTDRASQHAAIGYRAHTMPPQPPHSDATSAGSSGGCGLGSGSGFLLLAGSLALRLRSRNRR